jgi:hypoxanthine phosphoribosyltransferase
MPGRLRRSLPALVGWPAPVAGGTAISRPERFTMEILISADCIQERIGVLARQIAADYRDRPVTIVGVLTGCLVFMADLIRRLDLPLRLALIQASSYRGPVFDPGKLQVHPELVPDVRGRHVLLLDDILDTGQTLEYLTRHLQGLGVLSLRVAVLLRKQGRQRVPLQPHYCGFDIPDRFVVGYGLDFNDEYRHLPYVAVLPAGQPVGIASAGTLGSGNSPWSAGTP